MEYEVTYEVKFTTTVKVEEGQTLEEALNDIDVPEGAGSYYKKGSFEVLDVSDDKGKPVDFE